MNDKAVLAAVLILHHYQLIVVGVSSHQLQEKVSHECDRNSSVACWRFLGLFPLSARRTEHKAVKLHWYERKQGRVGEREEIQPSG